MRCFFGVGVDHQLGLELISLRDRAMEQLSGAEPDPVGAGNFHLTLAFLGDLPAQRLSPLRDCAGAVAPAIRPGWIRFEAARCFPHARSRLFAVEGEADGHAMEFHRRLCRCIAEAGFPVEHRSFRPHITLVRMRHSFVPAPQWPVELAMPVTDFCLYESIQRPGGVHYRVLQRWELGGDS